MKLLCETQVINRNTEASTSARAVKNATLAIGFRTSSKNANGDSNKEPEIMHFTPQNKSGQRYKLRENIEKIFTRFVQDGKATISFRQPPVNLMIKCNPIQLKSFLQTIKLGLEGKNSINLRQNIAATTAIPQKSQPKHKLVVSKRSEYPTKGFPKTLLSLTLTGIQLCKISLEICKLRNLTNLNLSYNNITKLPQELGQLSLVTLCINKNALGETNCWQWLSGHNLQNSLQYLDMSENKLTYFPAQLIRLEKLITLTLNNNSIKTIPFGVRRMRFLRYLHMSSNLLESLPSAFNSMHFELVDVWGNPFQMPITQNISGEDVNANRIPALKLLSMRVVSKNKLPYSNATLPWMLVDILSEAPLCYCGKLCSDARKLPRAAMCTFENVKNLIFKRDRLIYADVVLCSPKCYARNQVLSEYNL